MILDFFIPKVNLSLNRCLPKLYLGKKRERLKPMHQYQNCYKSPAMKGYNNITITKFLLSASNLLPRFHLLKTCNKQ